MKALSFNNIFSHPKEDEDDMANGVAIADAGMTTIWPIGNEARHLPSVSVMLFADELTDIFLLMYESLSDTDKVKVAAKVAPIVNEGDSSSCAPRTHSDLQSDESST